MGKPISELEVEIFEWPDRFLVESEGYDRDYLNFWPQAERELYPHFVDLGIYDTGWCTCTDFRIRVEPYLFWNTIHRRECIHIFAARRYRNLIGSKPKQMPVRLFT